MQILDTLITLDVIDWDKTPAKIKTIQLDSQTRYVDAIIQDKGVTYDIGENATVTLTVIRPDKTGVQITGQTKAHVESSPMGEAVTTYGAYAEFTPAALAVKGKLDAQFMITSGGQVLRTEIFSVANGEALDASTSEWAGEYQGYNLDELVQNVNESSAKVDAMEEDVSDLKEGLNAIPIVFGGFIKGQQIQTYTVGRTITFITDSTNTRAINKTPIYFDRKAFLPTLTGYKFYICLVTSKDDLTVVDSSNEYVNHYWIPEDAYVILQVKRNDGLALTDEDMSAINSWIDYKGKEFSFEDVRRMCATKKSYGTTASFSNNHNNFTIAHITDVHSDVFRYANFRKFVDDHSGIINCAICTGDLVDNQQDAEWSAMAEVDGDTDVLMVVGNHDAGYQSDDTVIGDTELISKFGITTNTGKMYYYVDFGDYRIIILNQMEGKADKHYLYNSAEITWLLSVLDDCIANSKHVIIACHLPDSFPVSNNTGFYQRFNKFSLSTYPPMESGLEEVIDAFKRGVSVTATLRNDISVSHTFSGHGDFLCWMCGHYHGDFVGYSETHSDQLYLMGNCGACTPLPFKSSNMGETNSDLARVSGTPTEDCFNIYSFDLANRLVKVARIGANVNDMMIERKMAVYSI